MKISISYTGENTPVLEELFTRGKNNGVDDLEIIGSDKVHELEPNLSPLVKWALYAKTGSIICPYELTVAAIGNAMDNGADLKCNFEVHHP